MSSSGFFCKLSEELIARKDVSSFVESCKLLSMDSTDYKKQIYVIQNPLSLKDDEIKSSFFAVLSPHHKMFFLSFEEESEDFEDYIDEFLEDLEYLSKKFGYQEHIGRVRKWRESLVISVRDYAGNVVDLFDGNKINDPEDKRKIELVISLLTGSINDISRVGIDVPENILDKVKKQIILFDADQTNFLYNKNENKETIIQGLSGTGKTELLLHKLKETYVNSQGKKIYFTCHNKILADKLRLRIPAFFNFMRVDQQIEWNNNLWCTNAWGSGNDINSGFYRYICFFYKIPFHTYRDENDFNKLCKKALQEIESAEGENKTYAVDYLFVDESQDFGKSFFELCRRVVRNKIYVAGDIFQSIFGGNSSDAVGADYLLNQCYRTDPKTLMFAHGLSMGLFETKKLQWLRDDQWIACGYSLEKENNRTYVFTREPIRRFEDIGDNNECISIVNTLGFDVSRTSEKVVEIICNIKADNPTVKGGDIAVIILNNRRAYNNNISSHIELELERQGVIWGVNKAFETRVFDEHKLCVTNHNNVKGLEFPFVVLVCPSELNNNFNIRNAMYMAITRSFISSHLLMPFSETDYALIESKRTEIVETGSMRVEKPTESELENINQLNLEFDSYGSESYRVFLMRVIDESLPGKDQPYKDSIYTIVYDDCGQTYEKDVLIAKIRNITGLV